MLLVRATSPAAMAAPPGSRRRPLVAGPVRGLLLVASAVLAAVLAAGTLVTAAGPHAGDAATPRLDVPGGVPALATLHADLVFGFLGLLVGLGFVLHAVHAPRMLLVRFRVVVGVVLAQGALGGAQYALGVPEALVALHVLGAAVVTAAMAALWGASSEVDPLPVASSPPASRPVPDSVLAGRR